MTHEERQEGFDLYFRLSELENRTYCEEYHYRLGTVVMASFLDGCYSLPASMSHPEVEEQAL